MMKALLTIISLLSFAYANAQELNLGSFDPESKIKEAFILDDGYRRSSDGLVFLSSRDSLGKELGRTEPLFTMAYRRSDGKREWPVNPATSSETLFDPQTLITPINGGILLDRRDTQ